MRKMPYQELFDKQVVSKQFNSDQLLKLLLDDSIYPIAHEIIQVKKSTILLHEDEVHEYLYIIQSGLCSTTKDGHIKSFLKEDEVIGMNNILGNEASSFTITALTNMVLLKFTKEDVMLKLMHLQEGLFFLYNDMKTMNQHMVQRDVLHVVDTKERLKMNIVYLGVLYGNEIQNQLILPKNFTKKMVSNFINLTPTTVYNICKQLVEEGFLLEGAQNIVVNKEVATHELAVIKGLGVLNA